jgi:NAD(P)-dependent dehydrogenase (short-subunit alcohol dehydrogenase family)
MQYKKFNNDLRIEGKTAIITGGASGIGYAVASMFLQKGANVVIADISANSERIADSLGHHCVALIGNILDKQFRDAVVEKACKLFGGIDILVNSAGVVILDNAEDISEDSWDMTLDTNLKASFLMAQCVCKKMIEMKSDGVIINLASQAGLIALDKHVAYCASKGGVIALTKVLAYEWAEFNIRCNCVSPTVVMTDLGKRAWVGEAAEQAKQQIPLKRFAEPDEIAIAILFLASDAAGMITGENLVIDGGNTIQ